MRFFLLTILLPVACLGQNTIGLPDVVNYPKPTYRAGLQNWSITQDKNDIIYIANNEGLLSFDGKFWKLYPLPNKTIVRSVQIGNDGLIYVGGQDELGYFAPNRNGLLQYQSLVEQIPAKDRSFGDVWDIAVFRNSIFFRTPNKIFKLTDRSFSVYPAPSEWSYLGNCGNRLFSHDYQNGLMTFENNNWIPFPAVNPLSVTDPVTGMVPFSEDSILITTLKTGLFILTGQNILPFNTPETTPVILDRIYDACPISGKRAALATSNGGIHIIDESGHVIQHFSKAEGLQNNNVLCVFPDNQENLWLGLDNGIDFIAYNSAIKRIVPNGEDGPGYTAILFQNQLYAGTSGGLFRVPLQAAEDFSFSKGLFSRVANTTGQTWGLAAINNELLLGHHEGAFVVKGATAERISPSGNGYWSFVPIAPAFSANRVLCGSYKGLTFLEYTNNRFAQGMSVPGFAESSRFIAIDQDDNIWVSHPYHGVFKLTPVSGNTYATKRYTEKEGLPSALNNHIYKIKNEVLVATEKGVYQYNGRTGRFEPSPVYQAMLGDQGIRYLKEDMEGNIWFIHDKILGVADFAGEDTSLIYLPELNDKLLSGFEFIYPVNGKNVFVGSERGFFHINYEKYKKNIHALRVQIRSVRIFNRKDSLLFGGYFANPGKIQSQEGGQVPEIAHNWGTIRFEYASPLFGQQPGLEYSYRLKGLEENWSEWSAKTDKEYTHLPAGSYTFEVKVRNNLGSESSPTAYAFTILPPWYQSTWAYAAYLLLAGIGIFVLYKWQRKKFKRQQAMYEEEQRRLQYLHQLELNKAENELVTLRNEKLQADIDFKNSELATTAMHLVQKGELLNRIRTELNQVMKGLDNEKALSELRKMIKVLGEDEKTDKDWEHFAQHFDKVHSDFLVQLKEKHPNISPNEMKLCAYLRMNLSSKEIAQLMNISVRGVEISRYRLRKKLGITTETNLFDYLIAIK